MHEETTVRPQDGPARAQPGVAAACRLVVLIVILWAGPCGDWLEGRTNELISSPLGPFANLVYLWLVGWVFWRVVKALLRGIQMRERLRSLFFPLVVVLSVILPRLAMPQGGFVVGFTSWARANVDIPAIRQWAMTTPLDLTKATEPPRWGFLERSRELRAIEVPADGLPPAIARLNLEDALILTDRSAVLLRWSGGAWGTPMMVIGLSDRMPPFQIWERIAAFVALRTVQDGVYVYVFARHG